MKKIALIHGWGYKSYTKFGCKDAWQNRKKFIDRLNEKYIISKPNLPGFCGEPEPNKPWGLSDFANYFQVYLEKNNGTQDVVIGYSFGAAVALTWKLMYAPQTKLILISPAISRAYKKKSFIQRLFFIKKLLPSQFVSIVRKWYLRVIRNQYYLQGTKFLKQTYLNIVKVDMSTELMTVPPHEIMLIFGSNDTATPPRVLTNKIDKEILLSRIKIIQGGGHDIANTHTEEIISLIQKFVEDENRLPHAKGSVV